MPPRQASNPNCHLPLLSTHLQKAVPHQGHQQLVATVLPHQGRVLGGVHAREVEHGHVGLPVVVDGEVQGGQLLLGGEVGRLPGIAQQGLLVHILPGQQELRVSVVLSPEGEEARWKRPGRGARARRPQPCCACQMEPSSAAFPSLFPKQSSMQIQKERGEAVSKGTQVLPPRNRAPAFPFTWNKSLLLQSSPLHLTELL